MPAGRASQPSAPAPDTPPPALACSDDSAYLFLLRQDTGSRPLGQVAGTAPDGDKPPPAHRRECGGGGTDTQIRISHNPPCTQLCSLPTRTSRLQRKPHSPVSAAGGVGHSNRRLGSASLQLSLRPPRGWDSPGNTMHTSTAPHRVCGGDDPGAGQATPWALRVRGFTVTRSLPGAYC